MNSSGNGIGPSNLPQKKRILFVITQSEMGGAQQFLAQLVKNLDQEKFQWSVAVGSDGSHELRSLLPSNADYIIVPHLRRNPNLFDDILSILELRRLYKRYRPDIVFLNSSKAGFNGSLAALGLPFRLIYRIGGWVFNDPRPIWEKVLYRLLEKISARWKDDIVVNNKKDYQDAEAYGIRPGKKLHLIHNGIDPYRQFLPKQEARLKLQDKLGIEIPNIKRVVGTIANFYSAKGLEDLITAAPEVPDALFVVIGDGALRPELERNIAERGLSNRVLLVGRLENAAQYLPAFDVFALPSRKEGFPWVILEAMAAKIPIVTTSVGALPEVLEHEKSALLVPPQSPAELARAIVRVLNDEGLAQEMTIQAHQKLLSQFTLRSMIEKYERLFLSNY